jgi:hypothetical protein
LGSEADHHDKRQPATGNAFHCVRSHRAAPELFSESDLAQCQIAHDWNGKDAEDEAGGGERGALKRPQVPTGGNHHIRSQSEQQAAADPAGEAFRACGKRLPVS